ncbi:hypothetical protein KIH74_32710 [Kineosporia sp. J2-2]|uniref:Helix-turn-helix domain-containing protein n=1 Tax=Kineosporia corallincola TaxID=2835133 RepID=A0ABS5TSJ3_9ACTN|nr:hypothetical protein [Kineosporia corallincola]MBT0773753.1 hypothetical protein [Kineosporia corallincola]
MVEQGAAALVAEHLKRLQADRGRSTVMSAYVAALTDDAGWGVEQIAALLGVSRQSISGRRKQGRELRHVHAPDLAGLPLPAAGPADAPARTRSGLRVPDAEEITAREITWVRTEVGTAPAVAELPARIKLVAGLLDDAEARLTGLRERRAALAWSLTCFDPKARRGLQKAGHWQPDEFFAARTQALAPAADLKGMDDEGLRNLAVARGIPAATDPGQIREDYFTVTSTLIATQARRRACTQLRDDLIRRYVRRDPNGRWKGVTEVAGWINRSQSQVTQICDAPVQP